MQQLPQWPILRPRLIVVLVVPFWILHREWQLHSMPRQLLVLFHQLSLLQQLPQRPVLFSRLDHPKRLPWLLSWFRPEQRWLQHLPRWDLLSQRIVPAMPSSHDVQPRVHLPRELPQLSRWNSMPQRRWVL